jgi:hypothetical protein
MSATHSRVPLHQDGAPKGAPYRYDKTSDSYRGFVTLASIRLWMKHIVNTP